MECKQDMTNVDQQGAISTAKWQEMQVHSSDFDGSAFAVSLTDRHLKLASRIIVAIADCSIAGQFLTVASRS